MTRSTFPKSALLSLLSGGLLLCQAGSAGAQDNPVPAMPAPAGSISTSPSGKDPLGSGLEAGPNLSNGKNGSLFVPGQDVLSTTASPVVEGTPEPIVPGAPAVDPRPGMTGGKGISINGEESGSQKIQSENQDDHQARLILGEGKGAAPDPKFSRGVGDMTRGQTEALPGIEQLRDDKTGRAEFIWLDQAKFTKAPMEAPDRVKVRWKNRDYVMQLYFVSSGDAGKVDSRRTLQMAARMMVKPEAAAAAFTKACEETRSWIEETPNLRVATRWEKVSPLREDTDFYGFVYLGEENLAERLVKTGWANSQGKKVTGPGDERPSDTLEAYQKLEQTARRERLGLWGWTGGPKGTQFVPPAP